MDKDVLLTESFWSHSTFPSKYCVMKALYIMLGKKLGLDTKIDDSTLLFDETYKLISLLHMIYSLADEVQLQ